MRIAEKWIGALAGSIILGSGLFIGLAEGTMMQQSAHNRTVAEVIQAYGTEATARLVPYFEEAGLAYPPETVKFLALKKERRLEVWAGTTKAMTFIRSYPIRAASGGPGPKLREGDRQVPEGHYKIIGLNPNSSYHLSMKLNYPNRFDLSHAQAEGRDEPGSNIFIHGRAVSIGCLAMGDPAIEELFVLTAAVGKENVSVTIAPHDPRHRPLETGASDLPDWTPGLYSSITQEFNRFRQPTD